MKKIIANLMFVCGTALAVNAYAGTQADAYHVLFDQVLRQHVQNGQVDYQSIKADARFAEYIQFIAGYDTSNIHSKAEELAFWINAYNALAIKGILDGRSPRWLPGRYGFFKSARYRVGNKNINLYDLEHDIILPLGEPRIHFAIVCASRSCPDLKSEAYLPSRLEQQLEAAAFKFINDAGKNSFDGETIYISKIFDWFRSDFAKSAGSVQRYLAKYIADPEIVKNLREEKFTVGYLAYDWRLNDREQQ